MEVVLDVLLVPVVGAAVGVLRGRAEVGGAGAVVVSLGVEAVVEEPQELLQEGGEVGAVARSPGGAGGQFLEQGLQVGVEAGVAGCAAPAGLTSNNCGSCFGHWTCRIWDFRS